MAAEFVREYFARKPATPPLLNTHVRCIESACDAYVFFMFFAKGTSAKVPFVWVQTRPDVGCDELLSIRFRICNEMRFETIWRDAFYLFSIFKSIFLLSGCQRCWSLEPFWWIVFDVGVNILCSVKYLHAYMYFRTSDLARSNLELIMCGRICNRFQGF